MPELHLGDEILMAFADGELDDAVTIAVEQAMISNPAITRRIAGFLRSRRLIRAAFLKDTTLHVSPDLEAAVIARIKAFEELQPQPAQPERTGRRGSFTKRTWPGIRLPLAASFAVAVIGVAAYTAGTHQGAPSASGGPVAQLDNSLVGNVLDRTASGQEADLAIGRLRVISTYRLTSGTLCREFTLQSRSGKAGAVACHVDGAWNVTFALASALTSAAYAPADGDDLIATYLENAGAGAPLLGDAEAEALNEVAR